jgi:hypothetical protein
MGLRRLVSACCCASLLLTMAVLADRFHEQRDAPLHALGIAVDSSGRTVEVSSAQATYVDARATRGAAEQRQDQLRWLAAGTVPDVADIDRSLFTGALLDLHLLGRDHGVTVAGWTPQWRYVWPRDSAVAVSAFVRTGHRAEAEALLSFLQSSQDQRGLFQARYVPDRPGVAPDARGVQFDGTGWALWGLAELVRRAPPGERRRAVQRYRQLLDRSTGALLSGIDHGTGLPFPSPDYWETSAPRWQTGEVTLATAAITLAGMRSAGYLYDVSGTAPPAALDGARDALQRVIVEQYGPSGYPRRVGEGPAAVDLGVSFLLPPIGDLDLPGVRAAWQRAPAAMTRPAGGLAPGGSWRRDGISWTPTVALYAMAAACADPAAARHWLGWLAAHRTALGALPEKVTENGSPGSVAPLAWTAAAVLVAGDELNRGCVPSR